MFQAGNDGKKNSTKTFINHYGNTERNIYTALAPNLGESGIYEMMNFQQKFESHRKHLITFNLYNSHWSRY